MVCSTTTRRAHYLCGLALRRLGRWHAAEQSLLTALDQNPVFPDAQRELAVLYERQRRYPEADRHRQLADAADQRIAAFKAGQALPEDADLDLDLDLKATVAVGDPGSPILGPLTADTVVIVSGLPRSGTSMLMQMLAAGGLPLLTDGQRSADDSNPRGYYELEEAKQVGKNNAWLQQAGGKAVKIVAQLLPHLPQGQPFRIVFMARPLGEVVASQTAMLQRQGRDGRRLSERRLAATYRQQIESVRRVLSAHSERVQVLAVNYHDALSDPVAVAARLNAFLGGGLDEAAMAAAVEPALRHQRVA